jgi:hypothetical protein
MRSSLVDCTGSRILYEYRTMVLFRLQTVLSQLSQARWSRVLAEQIHMWGRPNVKSSILSLGCTTRYAPVSRKGFIPYLRFID